MKKSPNCDSVFAFDKIMEEIEIKKLLPYLKEKQSEMIRKCRSWVHPRSAMNP